MPIGRIASRDDYSRFVLKHLADHVATPHVLLVQWDGYVVNPAAWDDAFLDCDYLGARWFWHTDGHDVGNGGFSLRSLRLLQALQDPRIELVEAEDLTIGRTFRDLLEREHGIRFGDAALADRFAFEAAYPVGTPFGFHGLFNFCRVVPPAELAALVPAFSDAIARSPQLAQLLRNCAGARPMGTGDRDRETHAGGGARPRRSRAAARAVGGRARRRGRRGPQRPVPLRQRQALQAVPRRVRRGRTRSPIARRAGRARGRRASARRARRGGARLPRRARRRT